MSKKLTRVQILRLIKSMMKDNQHSIDVEMDLIGRSSYAPDVVDRARNMNKFVQWNEGMEQLLREIERLER